MLFRLDTTVTVVTIINIGSKVSSKKNDTASNVSAEETDGDGDDLITLLPLIQQCLAPPTSSSSSGSNKNDTAVAAMKRCRDTNTPFGRPIDSPLIHTHSFLYNN